MVKPELFVVIGCDTDPAIEPDSMTLNNKEKTAMWDDTIRGVKNVRRVLECYRDDFGNHPKITWFLRSDQQMYEIYGDWSWPANKYLSIWREFENDGDEIGWHPHLWRFNNDRGWYQEINDHQWVERCLKNGHDSLSNIFSLSSTRMGWDFHNNITMNIIDRLGIKVDLSALPGMKSGGIHGRDNIYDWSLSSEYFYHPSKTNYQRSGTDNLSILELPVTCSNIPLWLNLVKIAASRNSRRRYETEIAKHPYFFMHSIKKALQAISQQHLAFLVCYFHAQEMQEKRRLFSLYNFQSNLQLIGRISKKFDIRLHYITAFQATRSIELSE